MNTDRRFLWMTTGLLLLFAVAIMINATINFRNFSIQNTEQKAELTAKIVKEGLTTMMVNGTMKDRDLFLSAIRSPESVRALWVIRSSKVIDEYGPGLHKEKPHDAIDREVLQSGKSVKKLTEKANRVFYRITIPYVATSAQEKNCLRCHHVREGDVLGAISVEFDITDTRYIGLLTLLKISLITLLFLLIAVYVVKRLSRPYLTFFKELKASLSRLKEGDFNLTVKCDTRNREIRESAALYNSLIKKFQETLGRVENRLSSLLKYNPVHESDPLQKAADTIDTLSKIQRFKQIIEDDRSLDQIYAHLADVIRMEMNAEHFVIYAVNPRRNTRTAVYSTLTSLPCDTKSIDDAEACRAYRTETPADSTAFPTVCPLYKGEFPYYFCLPFHIHQSALVITFLAREAQTIARLKAQIHLLQNYLENARPVIETHILLRQLHEKSLKDGLTGIYNRKFLEELATKLSSQRNRGLIPYTVVMLDIDHFKEVNDTYGHSAGDMVIRTLAEIILGSIRKADIAARYGGEEFVLLLHKSSLEGGQMVAEKIRRRFEAARVEYGQEIIRCTVSAGVARYPDQGDTLKEVIDLADQALYQAKRAGRNRVVVFNEEERAPAPKSTGPRPNPNDRPA